MQAPLPVALLYSRVSRQEQGINGLSLDAQAAATRQYAARAGWLIGPERQDIMSGMKDARPQYQALLSEARRLRAEGKTVAIVVSALDRLGRRLAERLRVREELKSLGIELHSVREGGLVSDLVANVLGAVAEEEARLASVRVKETRARTMSNGWVPGGRLALGYLRRTATEQERKQGAPKSVLDADAERAPIVREAFTRVASGASVRAVARWLASLPDDVRQGRSASYHATRQMLDSRTYIGQFPDGTPGRWPALVDPATFERVQQRIARHQQTPAQASGRYLLTGLLRCPKCGGRMAGTVRWRGRPRYTCFAHKGGAGRVACSYSTVAAPIEGAVLDRVGALLDVVTDADLRPNLEAAWSRLVQPTPDAALARAHERAADKARERIRRLALLYADGALDRAGYELGREQAAADLDAAERALAALRGAEREPELPPLDQVLREAGGWQAILAGADTAARRDVLALIVETITPERVGWGKYEAKIVWTPLGEALSRLAEGGTPEPNSAIS